MSRSFKRTLTEEARDSLIASSTAPHSTPDDIATRLQSLGSRVRKSVAEGYTSPPSFVKANSTGNIFRSSRDTLREVKAEGTSTFLNAHPVPRVKRSHDDGYDSDGGLDNEDDMTITTNPDVVNRPMKPLRKPKKTMIETRSLPNGVLAFGGDNSFDEVAINRVEEEEDWSTGGDFALRGVDGQSQAMSFEPMNLS